MSSLAYNFIDFKISIAPLPGAIMANTALTFLNFNGAVGGLFRVTRPGVQVQKHLPGEVITISQ